MEFIVKNKLKHLLLMIISTILVFPVVGFLNASYYTTISKVNYWEEKSIVSLISLIVKNNPDRNKVELMKPSLESINFFDIKILLGNDVIIHKPLGNNTPATGSQSVYDLENYKLILTRRIYASAQDDYIYYIKRWMNPSKLFENRTLTVLFGHLTIFLFLELVWVVLSIKFRLNQLQSSITHSTKEVKQ